MTEFYEGQSVYLCPIDSNNIWVRGVVGQVVTGGLVKFGEWVEVDIRPEGESHILLVRPSELVRGDAG